MRRVSNTLKAKSGQGLCVGKKDISKNKLFTRMHVSTTTSKKFYTFRYFVDMFVFV